MPFLTFDMLYNMSRLSCVDENKPPMAHTMIHFDLSIHIFWVVRTGLIALAPG